MTHLQAALRLAALGCVLCIGACSRTPNEATPAASQPAPAAAPVASNKAGDVEWPYYAGNLAAQRYSPLDQINRDNVGKLEIAWRFQTGNYGPKPEARNEATPLMIGGVGMPCKSTNAFSKDDERRPLPNAVRPRGRSRSRARGTVLAPLVH